jgi:flagellar operon protein
MEKTFFTRSPQPVTPRYHNNTVKQSVRPTTSFADQLELAVRDVPPMQISKHAKIRMEQRGITIPKETWEKIGVKVVEAKTKGIQDSLVVLKDAALIVSAKNQTVITAMDREEAHSQIFTNINGTILIDS